MESFAFASTLFVVLLAGKAVSAQSSCNLNACMANVPQGNSEQVDNMGVFCGIVRETTNCLSSLMQTCNDNNLRATAQATLNSFRKNQQQCQSHNKVQCDTVGYNQCREMTPSQRSGDKDEVCRGLDKTYDCLSRVRCNMDQYYKQMEQLKKMRRENNCPNSDGSAFLYPSILSVALAVLLAFLGQKW